jgi:hypothetical protein
MRRSVAVIALVACAACAAEVASHPRSSSAEPVVGRLKTRNGTIDLTVGSFAPNRDGIPREATAHQVMADIDRERTSGTAAESRATISR